MPAFLKHSPDPWGTPLIKSVRVRPCHQSSWHNTSPVLIQVINVKMSVICYETRLVHNYAIDGAPLFLFHEGTGSCSASLISSFLSQSQESQNLLLSTYTQELSGVHNCRLAHCNCKPYTITVAHIKTQRSHVFTSYSCKVDVKQ